MGTHQILGEIYPLRIKCLDFSDDIVNVKYCFNHYFFKSLKYQNLDDLKNFTQFNRLLFYIHICNDDDDDDDTLNYTEDTHQSQLFELKTVFGKVEDAGNGTNIDDIVEIFKILIHIRSLIFRLRCAISILTDLNNDNKIHVKGTVIKKFLDSKNYGSEVLLRLAQTYNIHLLKDIPDDKKKILLDYNSNFKSFVNYLPKLEIEFNIDHELTSGFNIPYYLSVTLADKRNDNENRDYSEEANGILMSILFKVFNCSGEEGKELFLKNKDKIFQEFSELYKPVKRLIQFYQTGHDNQDQRNKKLQDRSIKHFLNGFSITNKESLYDRSKYAGLIIDNLIQYDLNQINHIVRSTGSEKEILMLFDHIMIRKNGVSL
ncbi:unnamed protein product, partial [Didymodactylos carnosus]